jgi:hypothetical protein
VGLVDAKIRTSGKDLPVTSIYIRFEENYQIPSMLGINFKTFKTPYLQT